MNLTDLDQQLDDLGISRSHRDSCRMPLCQEPAELVDAGVDMFNRPQQMTRETRDAWVRLCEAAARDGHRLKLVSAFRSVEYQCNLIRKKLDDGRKIDDILNVNAIPGYSEHHTGRAVDLHAGDGEPLEESFENEPAFSWLRQHAHEFGFHLSYPRDNPAGIAYEPWHWCYEH